VADARYPTEQDVLDCAESRCTTGYYAVQPERLTCLCSTEGPIPSRSSKKSRRPTPTQTATRFTRAALIGTLVRAVVQPISATENTDGGFNTESRYRLRLINYPGILGAQSQIEWNGKRYSIEGDARIYNGSRRTAHVDYVIVRR
jgi:hypothetical protein